MLTVQLSGVPCSDDTLFKYGCPLSDVPPGLEIRHGHDLLDLPRVHQLPHSSTLLVRCHDLTAAMSGTPITHCQDGVWSHDLPVCQDTALQDGQSGVCYSIFYFPPISSCL